MASSVRSILTERFGLRMLRPYQKPVVDRIMEGGNALVVMPTGSGKSLCYQLPAVALPQPGTTLVFSPLIALMEDQVSALKNKDIKAEYINSTLSSRERDRRCKKLAKGEYEIIYATPERMRKPQFVEALEEIPGGIKLLAIDEAHCISRWGHDLRPAYRDVGKFRKQLGNPATIALTATATRRVRDEVRRTLGLRADNMPLFATPIERPNLSLEAQEVWHDDDKVDLIKALANPGGRTRGTGIIYFARIKDLDHFKGQLQEVLGKRELAIYHGQLRPSEKKRVYQRFIEAEPEDGLVLLATNAFGMGVDKRNIRFIVHAQVPANVEAYFQEVGRAGRDGRKSRCLMLYGQDDLAIQHQFIEWSNPSADLLVRAAHAIEASEFHDFDVDDLQVMVAGKARTVTRGILEHTLISLAKRGIIEPTSTIGRYRFSRSLENGEVDPAAIQRKRRRDLQRLHDIVKLARCKDIKAFVNRYFDLTEDEEPRRSRSKGSRGGGRGRKRSRSRSADRSRSRDTGRKRDQTERANDSDKPGKRRRRRRRRSSKTTRESTQNQTVTQAAAAAPPTPDSAEAPSRKRRRRRRGGRGRGKPNNATAAAAAAAATNSTAQAAANSTPGAATAAQTESSGRKRRRRRRRPRRRKPAEAAAAS